MVGAFIAVSAIPVVGPVLAMAGSAYLGASIGTSDTARTGKAKRGRI